MNSTASHVTINTVLSRGLFDKIVLTQAEFDKIRDHPEMRGFDITVSENSADKAAELAKAGFRVVYIADLGKVVVR